MACMYAIEQTTFSLAGIFIVEVAFDQVAFDHLMAAVP